MSDTLRDASVLVSVPGWVCPDLDRSPRNVDDPVLGNARSRVDPRLHALVLGERRFGDLDEQERTVRMGLLRVARRNDRH